MYFTPTVYFLWVENNGNDEQSVHGKEGKASKKSCMVKPSGSLKSKFLKFFVSF